MQDVSTRAEQMGSSSSPVLDIFNVFNYLNEMNGREKMLQLKIKLKNGNRIVHMKIQMREITCLSAEIINFLD